MDYVVVVEVVDIYIGALYRYLGKPFDSNVGGRHVKNFPVVFCRKIRNNWKVKWAFGDVLSCWNIYIRYLVSFVPHNVREKAVGRRGELKIHSPTVF